MRNTRPMICSPTSLKVASMREPFPKPVVQLRGKAGVPIRRGNHLMLVEPAAATSKQQKLLPHGVDCPEAVLREDQAIEAVPLPKELLRKVLPAEAARMAGDAD